MLKHQKMRCCDCSRVMGSKPCRTHEGGPSKGSGGKGKWMLVTLVVPEFLVGKAIREWIQVREYLKELSEIAGPRWRGVVSDILLLC